jgi:hypothetical protein
MTNYDDQVEENVMRAAVGDRLVIKGHRRGARQGRGDPGGGGSREYIATLTAPFADRIRLATLLTFRTTDRQG